MGVALLIALIGGALVWFIPIKKEKKS